MSAYYELQNNPVEVVSLSEAKDFLRVDFSKDDAVINRLIDTATRWGEQYTARQFRLHQWVAQFEDAETHKDERYSFLRIKRSPVSDLVSVEVSRNGSYEAYTNFLYRKSLRFPEILLKEFVTKDMDAAFNYRVTFTSGYTELPSGLKDAILEHVAFLYENRADVPSALPNQIKSLYDHYKIVAGF